MSFLPHPVYDSSSQVAVVLWFLLAALPLMGLAMKHTTRRRPRGTAERTSDVFEALDAFPFITVIEDADHNVRFMNGKARAKFGDKTGEKCHRVFVGHEGPCGVCPVTAILHEGKECFTYFLQVEDGLVYESSSSPFAMPDGTKVVINILRDISQRLMIEKRMHELASAVETMRPSVIITDLNHKIIYVNPAVEKMLGYPPEEMLGRYAAEIFEGIPGNPIDLGKTVREGARNGYWEGEIFNRKKSGEIIPVFLRMCTIRDEKGKILGHAGISEDITQRKQLEEELIQKEKLSALGEFISAIAHEINNPLTGVLGYAEILQHAEDPKGFKADVQRLYNEAVRCQCLVKNLLTFARRSAPHKESSNVNEIVEISIDLKRHQLKADGVELTTRLDGGIPPAMLDPRQIQQVFLNIIDNAYHALREQRGPRLIVVASALRDGNMEISFSNNGPAIPEYALGKIFAPFFTTKEFGKGTGLGLSIAHGIVRDHGGEIRVQSEEGKETVFTISIPLNPSRLSNP